MWNMNKPQYPEPRWMTREEVATARANWYRAREVAHWRGKRRKTNKLLRAARKEIQRLRRELEKPRMTPRMLTKAEAVAALERSLRAHAVEAGRQLGLSEAEALAVARLAPESDRPTNTASPSSSDVPREPR